MSEVPAGAMPVWGLARIAQVWTHWSGICTMFLCMPQTETGYPNGTDYVLSEDDVRGMLSATSQETSCADPR